ncbi:MAG: ATP-binding cassette domain-containing protein, partial [Lachnospiraceae bacterium]|nr:ATP-binding cassette domain-containing protein [Lachnospiraceae bacterium]
MSIKIQNLSRSFPDITVFENLNLEFKEGTITCIMGKSGVGKTTLL